MSESSKAENLPELVANARFEIGGEDQLAELRTKHSSAPADEQTVRRFETDWRRHLTEIHIQTGTLLKTDMVSFPLGAGASKECGGLLIGTVPLPLEQELLNKGITGKARPRIREWLRIFYLTVHCTAEDGVAIPVTRNEILKRWEDVKNNVAEPMSVNFEKVLSLLH